MHETIKQLERRVGGLSNPSKMPGFSYGIPAINCAMGSLLRQKEGSVCSKCYAHKGMYVFSNVKTAQKKRLKILSRNISSWAKTMTKLLVRKYAKREKVFRWHDSGDLQSKTHLDAIVKIAKDLPDFRFWLPTKEYVLIRNWVKKNGHFPTNLTIRISAPMIGTRSAPVASTVSSTVNAGTGYLCPASSQNGECGDCRACWSKEIISVDYHLH